MTASIFAIRQGKHVLIYSRGGYDGATAAAIAKAMLALPVRSAVFDGEGVICGADGKSDFDAMRACFSRNGAPEPSYTPSMCWSWTVGICATSPGRDAEMP